MALLFWMNSNFETCFARLWDDLTGLLDACLWLEAVIPKGASLRLHFPQEQTFEPRHGLGLR